MTVNVVHADQEKIARLRRHLSLLRWCLALTIVGWVLAVFGGDDPRYSPPFASAAVACIVVMLVVGARLRRLERDEWTAM